MFCSPAGVQTDDEDYEVREALQGDSYHIEQESTSSSSTNRSSKMLLPRSRDLVLVEKPTQTKSKTDTETKRLLYLSGHFGNFGSLAQCSPSLKLKKTRLSCVFVFVLFAARTPRYGR